MTRRPFVTANAHRRRWGPKARHVVLLASVGAVLVVYALIVASLLDPPALGWVGFAIVSIVVLVLAALAPVAFERTRVSPLRPAEAGDQERRLLVIADSRCSETVLAGEILAHMGDAVAVHLVVPVRVSRLHFLTDDEVDEQRDAEEAMRITVGLVRQRGVAITGSVGSDKPLESMTDALGFFPATQVLLVTPPEEESYWLEWHLLAKARRLTRVPVRQVVVPSTLTRGSSADPPLLPHGSAATSRR